MSSEIDILQLRARVAELEARLDHLYNHFGLTYNPNAPAEDPRMLTMLRQGNLIEAIKIYRETHDVGLSEAKAAVEAIRARI